MIWLVVGFLVISIIINILLVWYIIGLLRKLIFVADSIGDFLGVIAEYQIHLESLYEMEMFYGDETLRGLIDHTSFIVDEIKKFESVYTLAGYEEEQDDGEQDDARNSKAPKEED